MMDSSRGSALSELPARWRDLASLFREHADERVARAYERAADEVEKALDQQENEVLTLARAAVESGYSADHLGRMVREGKIPNAGRPGAPRIARGDLPLKSRHVASPNNSGQLDRTQIVRAAIEEGAA